MTGTDRLWPRFQDAGDLAAIERVPWVERGLPAGTRHLVDQAAAAWPDRAAISALPSAAAWHPPVTLGFAELRVRAVQTAGVLARLGVGRGDPVGVKDVVVVDRVPLTAVGEVFEPAPRCDAIENVTENMVTGTGAP
ncbi:hypothetical protein [Nocardia sp. CC227C]|uniref:hypothetical protein n=1 Tax=Nocardia sp. CC227C TaxID=3044562 RepID=UPI00278BCD5D|nr:hypothetical protein [Nocardia sp. CC227C]